MRAAAPGTIPRDSRADPLRIQLREATACTLDGAGCWHRDRHESREVLAILLDEQVRCGDGSHQEEQEETTQT